MDIEKRIPTELAKELGSRKSDYNLLRLTTSQISMEVLLDHFRRNGIHPPRTGHSGGGMLQALSSFGSQLDLNRFTDLFNGTIFVFDWNQIPNSMMSSTGFLLGKSGFLWFRLLY